MLSFSAFHTQITLEQLSAHCFYVLKRKPPTTVPTKDHAGNKKVSKNRYGIYQEDQASMFRKSIDTKD